MTTTVNMKHMARLRYPKFGKKYVRHIRVEVLTRVNSYFFNAMRFHRP